MEMVDIVIYLHYNLVERTVNEHKINEQIKSKNKNNGEDQQMNSRDAQREKRKEEILLCSLNIFIKKGFAATKIRDIASELKISTGLFFHYFKSKEEIYEELITIAI